MGKDTWNTLLGTITYPFPKHFLSRWFSQLNGGICDLDSFCWSVSLTWTIEPFRGFQWPSRFLTFQLKRFWLADGIMRGGWMTEANICRMCRLESRPRFFFSLHTQSAGDWGLLAYFCLKVERWSILSSSCHTGILESAGTVFILPPEN